jgi:hypothetical protein
VPQTPLAPQRRRSNKKEPRAARRGTPIRNSLLLLIFGALLALIVLVSPKEPLPPSAAVLADGTVVDVASQAAPTLRLSEVMASNSGAYPDDKGAFPDWVEIENYGEAPVNLAGIGLSDRDDRVLFIFPEMELPMGGRVVVYCDDTNAAAANAALHARFKVSSLGEEIYLFDASAVIMDSVAAPAMGSDMSYALSGGQWVITDLFTPGWPNTQDGYDRMRASAAAPADGLVISELLASNVTTVRDEDGDYVDWIELYNGTGLPIDLHNYALSDDGTNLVKWRFPQGVVIAPGEYYLVYASGKDRMGANGRPHTNFKLAAEGETVFFSNILSEIIDQVTYDNLDDDVSWGRVEGTDYAWQTYAQPTPALSNTRIGELEMDRQMRAANSTGIYISEVMTSSAVGVETPYGTTSYDWVELVNLGNTTVNLRDWGLSDRVGRPRKWQLPNISLAPGQYTLVFPSGLSESPTGSGAVHADYRLSALGETMVLSTPQGQIVDKLVVPRLATDCTYGRDFDQGGLFYYETATAGAKNAGEHFPGYAPAPTFDTPGGIYPRNISVTLTAPEGVRIRYTTDGSEPTLETGYDYTEPIALSDTVSLRARGFVDGLNPSDIVTETYLMKVYHILPVISVTADPNDLWNEETGIFAMGPDAVISGGQYKNATFMEMKEDDALRERAANFEYFTPEGTQLLNQGVALMLNGNYSLSLAQKSLRITAKAKYGSTTLPYAFFDDRPYTEYRSIVLRNGGNMGPYERITDSLISKMVDWTDSEIIHMASTPCIVYINGQYWGQYYIRERIDTEYIARYHDIADPDKIDFIKGGSSVLNGSYSNYDAMRNYAKNNAITEGSAALQTLENWVDVENLFDMAIFESFFGNTDAGNQKAYRLQGDNNPWRWVLFDLDWGYFYSDTKGFNVWLNESGFRSAAGGTINNSFLTALLKIPKYREQFLTRYGELFQNYLSDVPRIHALIDEMVAEIEPEMGLHFMRWAGETSKEIAFDPPADPSANLNYWKNVRINGSAGLKVRVARRPYHVWTQAQEWFSLTDEEMLHYFGPCPELPE